MQRLTKWNDGMPELCSQDEVGTITNANYINSVRIDAVRRLAEYEDTRLEPEEIQDMLANTETRALAWFERHYGIGAGRMMQLAEADKEGRLVVLPCSIETPIFLITAEKEKHKQIKYSVKEYDIDHFVIGGTKIPMITACSKDNEWAELIDGTQKGHEFFLTREEAEAALQGGGTE